MPDAFENYATHEMHRLKNVSPMTPGQLDSPFTYDYDHRTMSTAGIYSPSSIDSPQEVDTPDNMTIDVLNLMEHTEISICKAPEIKILIQPVEKFRFRYKSEMMGTHGSLLGEREGSHLKKEVPTVQLVNCPLKNAVIRCTVVTADEDRRYPHAHHLVRKYGNTDKDDPHDIEVSDQNNYIAMFCSMGIIHTAKKNIKEELVRKRTVELKEQKRRLNPNNDNLSTKEIIEMGLEAEQAQKWMNLNSVALCFQGFAYGENNVLYPITDKMYSRPINNLKSALTGELKICRIDKHSSSAEGNEEVWLLVEKVGKKNIRVKFYELNERDNVIWESNGQFSELDVHHQYAIVIKTPPYKDVNITRSKEVYIRLERPSDGEISNSVKFSYKPSDTSSIRKRPRLSSLSKSSEDFKNSSNSKSLGCMLNAETCMDLDLKGVNDEKLLSFSGSSFLSEFDKHLQALDNEGDGNILPSGYAVDGLHSTEHEKIDDDFARVTLKTILKMLKENESKKDSEENVVKKMQELLQETTYYGDTPLHFALRHEQVVLASQIIILVGRNESLKNIVNLQNSAGKTPLHLAILQNRPDMVRALLKLGADPNLCDDEDATALHTAVNAEANKCLDELLKYKDKLNLEAHTESGWSALLLAAKLGSFHGVKALIDAGADVNSTDMSYGRTALHIAVDGNHKHIVNYLLTKTKIDVNMKNFGGNTALHSAVVKGGKFGEELVKLLKGHGADPSIRNNNIGKDVAERMKSMSIEQRTSNTPTPTELLTEIKSEESDSDDNATSPGESSFDLAREDQRLINLLTSGKAMTLIPEEMDIKEEEMSDDDITLQNRAVFNIRNIVKESVAKELLEKKTSTSQDSQRKRQQEIHQRKRKQQLEQLGRGDDKLDEKHIQKIIPILDRTGGWERLAYHLNLGSLVRLHKKTKSPSTALFKKIKLQNPDITVKQMKKFLIEVKAFEAASELEDR